MVDSIGGNMANGFSKTIKIGNTIYVRIPKNLVNVMNISENDIFFVRIRENKIILEKQ